MAAPSVRERAAAALLAEKGEVARAVTGALYAELPGLEEKYGERGRARCLEDMRYHLEHLAPAVMLGEPALFARYVAWLRDVLGPRGIPADEVRRSLELIAAELRARLAADEAEVATESIAAGLRSLAGTREG